jgi:hypothetical protein
LELVVHWFLFFDQGLLVVKKVTKSNKKSKKVKKNSVPLH